MKESATLQVVNALTRLLSCGDIPEELPLDPMLLFQCWLAEAVKSGCYDDPNAMTVATSTPSGAPSARIVLCKAVEHSPPAIVFYTSYESRKGRELEANPRAATVFHWPHAKRQVRVEGNVERVSPSESDEYFRSRSLLSRIGSSVSPQSEVIPSRAVLVAAALKLAGNTALAGLLPRPAFWGGYRIHIHVIEFWSARDGRLNDRVRWTRIESSATAAWVATRLGP